VVKRLIDHVEEAGISFWPSPMISPAVTRVFAVRHLSPARCGHALASRDRIMCVISTVTATRQNDRPHPRDEAPRTAAQRQQKFRDSLQAKGLECTTLTVDCETARLLRERSREHNDLTAEIIKAGILAARLATRCSSGWGDSAPTRYPMLSLVPARNLVHGRSFDLTTAIGLAEEASMSLASLTIRLLTALVLAAPVAACDVFQGRQSVAEYADDSTITNGIRAKFVEDPVVHFGDVGVTTLNGNVRLTGQVNSERERQRAAQIARGVKGVRSVSNEIAVR
jgi:hyperosmotically inducible protein